MEVIAIIPAKGHSTRCLDKNTRDFAGEPLFLKSVHYAIEEGFMPLVASEDEDILRLARREGVPTFSEAPHPDTPMEYLINQILQKIPRIKRFSILQPSSPLRRRGLLREMMSSIGDYGCFTAQKIKLVGLLNGKIYRNDLRKTDDKYFWLFDGNILCRNADEYRKNPCLLTEGMKVFEEEIPYYFQIDYEKEFKLLNLLEKHRKDYEL